MEVMSTVKDVFSLARHNRYDELKKVINSGNFPIDSTDSMGNTLLLVACQNGLKRVAKLALRNDANINIQNKNGNTALHFCYLFGFGQTLGTFLIEQGADEEILNNKKLPPRKVYLSGFGSLPALKYSGGNANDNNEMMHDDDDVADFMDEFVIDDDGYDNVSVASSHNNAYTYDDYYQQNSPIQAEREESFNNQHIRENVPTQIKKHHTVSSINTTSVSKESRLGSGFRSPIAATGSSSVVTPTVKRTTHRRPPPTTPHPDDIGKPSIYEQAAQAITPTSVLKSSSKRLTNPSRVEGKEEGSLALDTTKPKVVDVNSITLAKPSDYTNVPKQKKETPTTNSSFNPNVPKLPASLSSIDSVSIVPIISKEDTSLVNKQNPNKNGSKSSSIPKSSSFLPPATTISTSSSSASSKPILSSTSTTKLSDRNSSGSATQQQPHSKTPIKSTLKIDLMEAMASCDYGLLSRAVDQAEDREIHAAMLNACARGNLKAVNILISQSPEDGLVQGAAICARNGHLDLLKLLLESSEDIRLIDNSLVQAASKGLFALVEYMVSLRRASTNALKRSLLSAATKAHYPVIEMLIPQVEWDDRRDALVLCCKHNHIQCASLLIEDLPGRFMDQPLAICAAQGHLSLISQILSPSPSSEYPSAGASHLSSGVAGSSYMMKGEIEEDVVKHAKSIAEASNNWDVVEFLASFITNNFYDRQKPYETWGSDA